MTIRKPENLQRRLREAGLPGTVVSVINSDDAPEEIRRFQRLRGAILTVSLHFDTGVRVGDALAAAALIRTAIDPGGAQPDLFLLSGENGLWELSQNLVNVPGALLFSAPNAKVLRPTPTQPRSSIRPLAWFGDWIALRGFPQRAGIDAKLETPYHRDSAGDVVVFSWGPRATIGDVKRILQRVRAMPATMHALATLSPGRLEIHRILKGQTLVTEVPEQAVEWVVRPRTLDPAAELQHLLTLNELPVTVEQTQRSSLMGLFIVTVSIAPVFTLAQADQLSLLVEHVAYPRTWDWQCFPDDSTLITAGSVDYSLVPRQPGKLPGGETASRFTAWLKERWPQVRATGISPYAETLETYYYVQFPLDYTFGALADFVHSFTTLPWRPSAGIVNLTGLGTANVYAYEKETWPW